MIIRKVKIEKKERDHGLAPYLLIPQHSPSDWVQGEGLDMSFRISGMKRLRHDINRVVLAGDKLDDYGSGLDVGTNHVVLEFDVFRPPMLMRIL